jgi:hypothetical protein
MDTELQVILLIRSYNRPEYLQTTLSSVLASDIDICVKRYIFDDCSDDFNTIQLLSNRDYIDITGKEFLVIRGETNVGCKQSYVEALNYIKNANNEDNLLICTIDNDVVVKPNFISIIRDEYYKVCNYYKSYNVLLTGFNPTNAHVNMVEDKDSFYRKVTIGGVNFVFHISFTNFIINTWSSGDHDWGVVNEMNNQNMPICCIKNSVLNHIGLFGLHSYGSTDIDERF